MLDTSLFNYKKCLGFEHEKIKKPRPQSGLDLRFAYRKGTAYLYSLTSLNSASITSSLPLAASGPASPASPEPFLPAAAAP